MTKKYALLNLAIGIVEQGDDDTVPHVSFDEFLPESDEELLKFVKNIRRQIQYIAGEIAQGEPMGGDRDNPHPVTSLEKQAGDLCHLFATYTREQVQMTDVRDDPREMAEKTGFFK